MSAAHKGCLTWEQLADLYDAQGGGRRARTLPMDTIFAWAERQKDRFRLDAEGYIYLRDKEPKS